MKEEQMEKIKRYELSDTEVDLLKHSLANDESIQLALKVREGEAKLNLLNKLAGE